MQSSASAERRIDATAASGLMTGRYSDSARFGFAWPNCATRLSSVVVPLARADPNPVLRRRLSLPLVWGSLHLFFRDAGSVQAPFIGNGAGEKEIER